MERLLISKQTSQAKGLTGQLQRSRGWERGSQGTLSICRHAASGQTPFVSGLGALECCVLLVQVPQEFLGRLAGFWYQEPAMVVSKTFRFIPPVNAKVPHDSNGWGKKAINLMIDWKGQASLFRTELTLCLAEDKPNAGGGVGKRWGGG